MAVHRSDPPLHHTGSVLRGGAGLLGQGAPLCEGAGPAERAGARLSLVMPMKLFEFEFEFDADTKVERERREERVKGGNSRELVGVWCM